MAIRNMFIKSDNYRRQARGVEKNIQVQYWAMYSFALKVKDKSNLIVNIYYLFNKNERNLKTIKF